MREEVVWELVENCVKDQIIGKAEVEFIREKRMARAEFIIALP